MNIDIIFPGSRCHHFTNGGFLWMMINLCLKTEVCKPTYKKLVVGLPRKIYLFNHIYYMHPGTYIVQNHTKIVCMNDKNIRSHPILMEAVHLERKTPSIHHFFKRVFISPGRKPTLFLSPNCNHQKKYRQKKRCFTKIRNTFIIRVTRANRDIRNKVEIATVWARYGSVTLQPT